MENETIENILVNFKPAPLSFFRQSTENVAKELVGCLLLSFIKEGNQKVLLRIVETEAYLSYGDEASHSFRGITKRNQIMFKEGGVIYVYKIYGIHHCINVVTEIEGKGSAVLLRAMECVFAETVFPKDSFRGPGKLAKSLGFTLEDNGITLCGETPKIFVPKINDSKIRATSRIGISKSTEKLLRFCLEGSSYVSVDWKKGMA